MKESSWIVLDLTYPDCSSWPLLYVGTANLCGISCVKSKNENKSSMVTQITSAAFETGAEARFVCLNSRKFSASASTLLLVVMILHHSNIALHWQVTKLNAINSAVVSPKNDTRQHKSLLSKLRDLFPCCVLKVGVGMAMLECPDG